jgi:HEAT repeat protein
MKKNKVLQQMLKIKNRIILALVLITSLSAVKLEAGDENSSAYHVTPEDIIASAQAKNLDIFNAVSSGFIAERARLNNELLNIFKNPKSSNPNRCAAAFYLGEMRSPNAVDALAPEIMLHLNGVSIDEIPMIMGNPVADALVKIGNPSIPAVIRNLAESDDVQVRKLSLQVLYRIDGDKDISQLRLQKALKVEKDSQKQARLRVALKALSATSFGN